YQEFERGGPRRRARGDPGLSGARAGRGGRGGAEGGGRNVSKARTQYLDAGAAEPEPQQAESAKRSGPRDVTERFVYPDDRAIDRPFNYAQLRRLFRYMNPYRKQVLLALVVTTVGTAANLAVPFIIG